MGQQSVHGVDQFGWRCARHLATDGKRGIGNMRRVAADLARYLPPEEPRGHPKSFSEIRSASGLLLR
eukprot:6792668-Alexandrium_andersonii.AAC.1